MDKIEMKEALMYEVMSSLWAGFIWFEWGRELASSYYAWKVKRKYRRYSYALELHNKVKAKLK